MLDNQEFDTLRISYIELDWELIEKKPVCTDVHFADLFKENPDNLYINWAAAMQIQFHVSETGQSYTGNQQQWATDYLKHFVQKAKERTSYMHKKFIEPFERYLK